MSGQAVEFPIEDDELIYRRVPISRGFVGGGKISPLAFAPHRNDDSGISVARARLTSVEKAAQGASRQGYHLAVLRVGDLRRHNIDVVAAPLLHEPAHAEIPSLTWADYQSPRAEELQHKLASLVIQIIEGPIPPLDS